jgi:hypothetical protein
MNCKKINPKLKKRRRQKRRENKCSEVRSTSNTREIRASIRLQPISKLITFPQIVNPKFKISSSEKIPIDPILKPKALPK